MLHPEIVLFSGFNYQVMKQAFYLLLVFYVSIASCQVDSDTRSKQIIQDRQNTEWAQSQDYVLMISIDGFRHDYAEKFNATNILKLEKEGVAADQLIPSFPSKTFPNHFTLITGLLPGNHGLVGNSFYSRSKKGWYRISDKSAVRDPSWYTGTPLWTLAEMQGMLSASFFWVGSEAPIKNILPTYLYPYDGSVPNAFRIQQVIEWLKLPEEVRPHMITAYFSLVDDAGHEYGPDAEETKEAVLEVDRLVGQLMAEVAQMGLPVHVVLVSDHGMSTIDQGLVLPDLVDLDNAKVSYSFPPMIYQEDEVKREKLYQELLSIDAIDVYTQETLPEYLIFKNEDRLGDIILHTEAPVIIQEKPYTVSGGTHGFNPYTNDEMGAIFYAKGPKIKQGLTLPPVENIHVYPFVAHLLGLKITEPIDGKLAPLAPALK